MNDRVRGAHRQQLKQEKSRRKNREKLLMENRRKVVENARKRAETQ